MNMLGLFQWSVRQSADVETQMTSVEKTLAYTSLVTEDTEPDTPSLMPSNWPQYGIITYEGVSVNHNNDNTKALRNAWCCIRAHEMVGIVGKAGAGKKTFLSALLGLVPSSGTIRIDGINIHEIPLPKLRESIAVIPENPVLFYGTVRDNIDPHGDFTDEHIWKMLDEVHLKEKVLMLPENLYTETCADNPCGFSTSQLQLVCVARAALKQKKILVLEEAVTNTDWRGSALIQQTIKTLFKHCTVVTLAHRLRTIIDYDRVMVLETGRINEFDTPYELLQNQNGAFYKMSLESGEDFKTLLQIAQHKFENKPYRSPSLETILSTEVNMNFSSAPVRSPNNFLPAFQTLRLTRTINHLSTGGNRFSMTDD
ncbi:multidrug resistance-associated protein 4 [Lingula anatina]|uniref:Multidrug resistance-associated protein 4 n=1 Tax=Lingula anatina TaxID=7574 RepID=A0A1S3HKD8_LINAN|nr:multidrug resistance-associated protein 4 [Lingula anatina]|eukprot:XP_013385464.1 multidrug resistance-associated protein 4 [Lingula anatina]